MAILEIYIFILIKWWYRAIVGIYIKRLTLLVVAYEYMETKLQLLL